MLIKSTGRPSNIRRLVRQLADSAFTAFCDECQAELPAFVSDELAGLPVDDRYANVAYHLDVCSVCRREYEALADLMTNVLQSEGLL